MRAAALLAVLVLAVGGCFPLLAVGAIASAPFMWENLPTCHMDEPIRVRCREVRGVRGGTVDGRVHDPIGAILVP